MNDDIYVEPTGRFPDGRIGDEARGELPTRIEVDRGQVLLDFGAWMLSLPPDSARELAVLLIRFAGRADGKPFTLEL